MRNALESEDHAQIEQTFLLVVADGDVIARTLRKNLEEAGVLKCSDEETSGNDSQGMIYYLTVIACYLFSMQI